MLMEIKSYCKKEDEFPYSIMLSIKMASIIKEISLYSIVFCIKTRHQRQVYIDEKLTVKAPETDGNKNVRKGGKNYEISMK